MSIGNYKKAVETMIALRGKASTGDKQAHIDKMKAHQEVRAMEREAAREGVILSATVAAGGEVSVGQTNTSSKRSLQEEYCRRFDNEKPVMIDGKETTMRKHHEQRLLGRN